MSLQREDSFIISACKRNADPECCYFCISPLHCLRGHCCFERPFGLSNTPCGLRNLLLYESWFWLPSHLSPWPSCPVYCHQKLARFAHDDFITTNSRSATSLKLLAPYSEIISRSLLLPDEATPRRVQDTWFSRHTSLAHQMGESKDSLEPLD